VIGSRRRRRAARGHLARLVAVLAVLAGLVLLHSPHCTDGMTAMPHLAASVGSGTSTAAASCGSSATMTEPGSQPATTADQLAAVCPAAGVGAVAAGSSHGSDGMGGLLATCLAFIVAVLAALLGVRPSRQQIGLVARLSDYATRIRAVVPRAPSLAELCVLRT
jgi:peptidoglycan/LPS O-acetylase OafA/YrhL